MAYSAFIFGWRGLMEHGVCQPFLKFAYWVTAFWFRWPDYLYHIRFQISSWYSMGRWKIYEIYLNQCWNIVNSNLKNELRCNIKRNSCIFIQENVFENVVCEMASILSRPRCVNSSAVGNKRELDIRYPCKLGPFSILRPSFPGMGIPMLKIRRSVRPSYL